MRVALSASHNRNEKAMALLATCDLIYTTQHHNLDNLQREFHCAIIRPIPDCCPDMIKFLEERHKDDEIIGFDDLMRVRSQGVNDV